jgi:hypothetical protein
MQVTHHFGGTRELRGPQFTALLSAGSVRAALSGRLRGLSGRRFPAVCGVCPGGAFRPSGARVDASTGNSPPGSRCGPPSADDRTTNRVRHPRSGPQRGRVQRRVHQGPSHPHSPDLSDLSPQSLRLLPLRLEHSTRCDRGVSVDPLDRLQLKLLNRSDVTAAKHTPCGWSLPARRPRTAGHSSPVVEPQHGVLCRRPGAAGGPDPHGYRSMPSPLSHPTTAWRPTLGGHLPLGTRSAGGFRRSTVSQPL